MKNDIKNIIRIGYLLTLISVAIEVLTNNFDLCNWINKLLLILIITSDFLGTLLDVLKDLFKKSIKIDNLNDEQREEE